MLKKINYNESKKLYILVKNDTELVFFCHTLSVSEKLTTSWRSCFKKAVSVLALMKYPSVTK